MTPCEHSCGETFPGAASQGLVPPSEPQPLPSACPCPTKMVRSYQRHQKRPLSAGLYLSIPWQWSPGHLVLSLQTTLVRLDWRSPFNSSKICTCSCCFQNLQICTRSTPGCSWPGHTWCTNSSLAETALWSQSLFSIYKGNNQLRFEISSHFCQADPQPPSFG